MGFNNSEKNLHPQKLYSFAHFRVNFLFPLTWYGKVEFVFDFHSFWNFPLQMNWSTGALSWNGIITVETYLKPHYTDLTTFYPYSYK